MADSEETKPSEQQEVETPIEPSTETPKETETEANAAEESDEEVEYVCPEEFNEREEMCKMFVGGLDKDTEADAFKEIFSKFGEIKEHVIIKKENSKSDRLFGFITFEKCDSLDDCLLARPHNFKEKELDVKRAVPKGQHDGTTGHLRVKKLHVANVPSNMDAKVLKKYLKARHPKAYGTIEEINFLQNKEEDIAEKGKNRGFGFITVSTEDFADRISIAESKFTLEGSAMRLSKAKPRSVDGGRGYQNNRRPNFHNSGYGGGWDQWNYYDYNYGYPQYPGYGGYGGGGYAYGGYGPQRGGRGGHRHHPYSG